MYWGPPPSRDEVDYLHDMPFKRHGMVSLILAVICVILIGIAINTAITFGVTDGLKLEEGLFSVVGFLFTVFWLIGWGFGCLIALLLFLGFTLGRAGLFVRNGTVEIRFGVPFFGLYIRVAASEVTSVELTEVPNNSFFEKKDKALLIVTDSHGANSPIGGDFSASDLEQLREALLQNERIKPGLSDEYSWQSNSDDMGSSLAEEHIDQTVVRNANRSPILFLVLVNLIPLLGAYLYSWTVGEIMVLYWLETLILLVFQTWRNISISPVAGLLTSLFTAVQVMAFMVIHFLFIWTLFVQGFDSGSLNLDDSMDTVMNYIIPLWPALLGLALSHGFSLYVNFFNNPRANRKLQGAGVLFARVLIMHVTIIIGGFLALLLENHWAALVFLIGLKILIDIRAHNKKHKTA